MIAAIVLASMVLCFLGYRVYGPWLARRFALDDNCPTPAVTMEDGVDYVPAKAPLLLGQHFSAIAAALLLLSGFLLVEAFQATKSLRNTASTR